MAKYSFEFKKKVVLAYLNGDEGLQRSRKNDIYSFQKKLSVVELYLPSEISFEQPRPTGRTRIPLQPSGFLTLGCIGTAI